MAHDLQEDVRKRKMFLVRYQEQKDAEKEGSPIQRQVRPSPIGLTPD